MIIINQNLRFKLVFGISLVLFTSTILIAQFIENRSKSENGYLLVLSDNSYIDSSKTKITLAFRDSRSGIKIFPHVSIEFNARDIDYRQEINMKDYLNYKGLSMSLPNGTLYITITALGYKEMILPINLQNQGYLPYIANLTPLKENLKFSFNALNSDLNQKKSTIIIGTLVDSESGLAITNGIVSTLDHRHEAKLDNTGYFRLVIPLQETHHGILDQNIRYVDLIFSAPDYQSRVIKNIAAWSVSVMEGTRMSKGSGIDELIEPEVGATSEFKGMNPNQEEDLNKTSAVKPADVFSYSGFPWNNCIPQTIVVGFADDNHKPCCSPNCIIFESFELNEYIRHVIPAEWFPSWQSNYGSNAQQAYIAGVIAIRSYAMYKILVAPYSPGYYHICSSTCCQVYGITNPYTDLAINSNKTDVLTYSGSVANSEFCSEANNKPPECFKGKNNGCGCLDGEFKIVNPNGGCGTSCVKDIVGKNKTLYGHGRGMNQYGSARWATGYDIPSACSSGTNQPNSYSKKNWTQILSQYYPNLTKISISTCALDCSNITNVNCNTTISGSNVGLANNINTYGGYLSLNETGPEKVYKLITQKTGTISISLSNVSYSSGNDLDVFILANNSCNLINPITDRRGVTSGLSVIYQNAPIGTYFIIVDGAKGSSGSYTLKVTAPCPPPNLTDNGSSKTSSGRNITITARVINTGGESAGVFSTGYWLSKDTYFGNDYGLGAIIYTKGLSGGGTNTFTNTWIADNKIPSGTYYILEYIDYKYEVNESDEDDNGWYLGNPIYLPPALSDDPTKSGFGIVGLITIPVSYDDNSPFDIPINDFDPPIQTNKNINHSSVQKCDVYVNDKTIIVFNINNESNYHLLNVLGKIVTTNKVKDNIIKLNVEIPGVYFLTINNGKGEICIQKVFID